MLEEATITSYEFTKRCTSAAFHEHVNTGNQSAILSSHTDVPVLRSLDLYREEAHPAGRQ
jgi:gentisate 1,2-dioxygenase